MPEISRFYGIVMIRVWAGLHRAELETDWELGRTGRPLVPIAPLD
jgi:hypothetical protein